MPPASSLQPSLRIGLGHDTHRLVEGDSFLLGGVRIAHNRSLLGHSDADVLLHGITDAILGAAALGDIGDWFPDNAPENKNRSSVDMLKIVYEKVQQQGYVLENLDCIIFAEKPKLGPLKQTIRKNVADILNISPDQVNIKAKTGEKVGPVGREEAICVEVIALLSRTT